LRIIKVFYFILEHGIKQDTGGDSGSEGTDVDEPFSPAARGLCDDNHPSEHRDFFDMSPSSKQTIPIAVEQLSDVSSVDVSVIRIEQLKDCSMVGQDKRYELKQDVFHESTFLEDSETSEISEIGRVCRDVLEYPPDVSVISLSASTSGIDASHQFIINPASQDSLFDMNNSSPLVAEDPVMLPEYQTEQKQSDPSSHSDVGQYNQFIEDETPGDYVSATQYDLSRDYNESAQCKIDESKPPSMTRTSDAPQVNMNSDAVPSTEAGIIKLLKTEDTEIVVFDQPLAGRAVEKYSELQGLTKIGNENAKPEFSSHQEYQAVPALIFLEDENAQLHREGFVSAEDLTETSSLESFSTVMHLHTDKDDDRLAELASLSSSFHSDVQGSLQDINSETSPNTGTESDERADDEYEMLEEIEVGDVQVHGIQFEHETDESLLQFTESVEIYLTPTLLASIKEEEEKSGSQKTTSSSEKIEIDTSDSSKQMESSSDMNFLQKSLDRSGERDDISVSSSLQEFERLERELQDKGSSDSNSGHQDSPSTKREEKDDADSISSSLAEFEHLEHELLRHSDTMELIGSVTQQHSPAMSEIEDCGLPGASLHCSNTSLEEFERLEQQLYLDEQLEAEAQKVAILLEQGSLPLISESDGLSEKSSEKDFNKERLSEFSDRQKSSTSSISSFDKDEQLKRLAEVDVPNPDYPRYQEIVQIIRQASQIAANFEQETDETQVNLLGSYTASLVPATMLDFESVKSANNKLRDFKEMSEIDPEHDTGLDGNDSLDRAISSNKISIGEIETLELTRHFVNECEKRKSEKVLPIVVSTIQADSESESLNKEHCSGEKPILTLGVAVTDDFDLLKDSISMKQIVTQSSSLYLSDICETRESTRTLPVMSHTEEVIQKSAEFGDVVESHSCESFDTDSVGEKQGNVMHSMSEDSLGEGAIGIMDISVDSSFCSQSSNSSATFISNSSREIMEMSLESQSHDGVDGSELSASNFFDERSIEEMSATSNTAISSYWHEDFFGKEVEGISTKNLADFDLEGNSTETASKVTTNRDAGTPEDINLCASNVLTPVILSPSVTLEENMTKIPKDTNIQSSTEECREDGFTFVPFQCHTAPGIIY